MSYDFMSYDFFTISPCKGTAFMPIKEYYVVKESQRKGGDAIFPYILKKGNAILEVLFEQPVSAAFGRKFCHFVDYLPHLWENQNVF